MYRVTEFKKEHLMLMDLRDHEAQLLRDGYDAAEALEGGVNCTGIIDGKIVCAGGVRMIHPGCGEIWLIPTIHIHDHTKTFVKGLREWLFSVRKDLGLYRMQTICLNDDLHNRWMRFLGFEKEGIFRKFMQGRDYAVYARLWENE